MDHALKRLRQERLLTQEELAAQAGITVSTLSRIETGKTSPRLRTIRDLAQALGISPNALREILSEGQLPLIPRLGGGNDDSRANHTGT